MSLTQTRIIISIFIYLSFIICFAPGGMSPDSFVQYQDAVKGVYTNLHPPVMAFVWHWLLFFQEGPLPMLCFQYLMLSAACYLLSGLRYKNTRQWLWLFLPLLPQVYVIAPMIWKDVSMSFSFFLAFACYTRWRQEASRGYLIAAVIFFLYGCLLRYNSICAIAIPLWLFTWWQSKGRRFIKSCAITLCLLIAVTAFYKGVERLLVHKPDNYGPLYILAFDEIGATSHVAGKNLFLPELDLSKLPLSEIPKVESGVSYQLLKYGNAREFHREIYFKNIKEIIKNSPLEYLQAKFNLFMNFSSFPFKLKYIWAYEIHPHMKINLRPSKLRDLLQYPIQLSQTWHIGEEYPGQLLFLPIFWIPCGIILFIAGLKMHCREAGKYILLLTTSALGYYGGWLIVPSVPDYRYILWIIISLICSLIILFYNRRGHEG